MGEFGIRLNASGIDRGKVFGRVTEMGRILGEGMTEKAAWHIVKDSAKRTEREKPAPHDFRRRTCAWLCHSGRRVGTGSVPTGACFHSDDRTLPRLQAADSVVGRVQDAYLEFVALNE